ncbi:serine hydrolase domain-containing protein [Lutibacter holmesii]|uniref:Serine hydrolase domain-containing protein n=1 Tax=Lutibacter holmesii TaxID=1137985 RepID=A0ABW3WKM5_9FLAO
MRKFFKYGLSLLVVVIAIVVVTNYKVLNIVTGFAAKSTCSCTFEGNRNLASIEAGDNDIFPVKYATNTINFEEKSVSSTFFGLKKRTAIFKKGVGCVLVPEGDKPVESFTPNRTFVKNEIPYPYGNLPQKDTVFPEVDYKKLDKTVSRVFDEGAQKIKRTRAVLVLYKDKIIAEKYANGFSKNSQLLGWSMTKSIASAAIGVLEKKGVLSKDDANLFPEWSQDKRANITLNNVLQMNTGLEWDENYNTISDVTKMLYLEEDMTKSQLSKSLVSEPNNSWNYSSGTTNLLTRIINNKFNTKQEALDFWYAELIDKIGMNSMILETDLSGNYVASSYGWATARDWAKFGLLYLHKGNWNGTQILNESWVNYSVTPTNGSNGRYGAQFWLNAGGEYPNVPKELFSCNGYQGQYVFVIPTKNLVIVRFGLSKEPAFNIDEFLSGIIASIN